MITLVLGFIIQFSHGEDVCRCVALEGGGSKGAFEVGVIQGMAETLPEGEVAWDIITGVSTGALNTLYFSMYPKGRELQMAQEMLSNVWLNLNGSSSIYVPRPQGIVDSILH